MLQDLMIYFLTFNDDKQVVTVFDLVFPDPFDVEINVDAIFKIRIPEPVIAPVTFDDVEGIQKEERYIMVVHAVFVCTAFNGPRANPVSHLLIKNNSHTHKTRTQCARTRARTHTHTQTHTHTHTHQVLGHIPASPLDRAGPLIRPAETDARPLLTRGRPGRLAGTRMSP
jgi:hypothetical protein